MNPFWQNRGGRIAKKFKKLKNILK